LVSLSSGSGDASVPASVTVAAGRSTATFTVKTVPVASLVPVALTATLNGESVQTTLNVEPPILKSLSVSPSMVKGGKTAQGTVTIGSAAPAGGLAISLTSTQSAAAVPATVVIPAGKTSAKFTISTTAVKAKITATIAAAFGGVTKTAPLTID
jgi:hypothetical protein